MASSAASLLKEQKILKSKIQIDEKMKKIILSILASGFLTVALAQVEKGNILIKNGTVLTITKGILESTDVLVKDGKITQIAKGIAAPAGVKIIDASGLYVMPGIIDAHSHIGLDAINEGTNAITPEVWTGCIRP